MNENGYYRLYAQEKDDKSNKLKPAEIAGIVVGCVVVVGVIIFLLVFFLVIKKRKNKNDSSEKEAEEA